MDIHVRVEELERMVAKQAKIIAAQAKRLHISRKSWQNMRTLTHPHQQSDSRRNPHQQSDSRRN